MISTALNVDARLIHSVGSDESLARAAMVSTGKDDAPISESKLDGLIRYLLRSRHGSPFEHGSMTFFVACPIFVAREFVRHRVGWSYSEISGRYAELPGEFYLVDEKRPMVNIGTAARPEMAPGGAELTAWFNDRMMRSYEEAWSAYQDALARGVANELARICLPVGIFTRLHVTCNPRSMMHFLSLRTQEPAALFPSRPQYEIEQVARKLEAAFGQLFPITYKHFCESRVAP